MGFFNSVGQMFDNKPGSPIEDWLRQQGIMGPAAANGTVNPDGGTQPLFGDRPAQATPGYGDGVASSVGGGASSPRGLFANGRKPNSLGPSIPEASPQLSANTSNAPLSVAETAGIEQSRVGRGMTGMEGGRGKLGGIDLQAALADNAMKTPPKKRGGGFNWGDALLAFAGGPQVAYHLRKDRMEREGKAEQAERMAVLQSNAYNYLVYKKGLDPAQADLIVQANPEKLAEEWATSQRTREVSEGETIDGPNGRYTAPKTYELNNNVYRFDPQAGAAERIIQGQTEAERYAETLGFQPSSPDFIGAVQDYTLKNDGPTAFGQNRTLQNDRLRQSDTNSIRSAATSAANSARSAATSRANSLTSTAGQLRSTAARIRAGEGRGGGRNGRSGGRVAPEGMIIQGAGGQKLIKRGGQWVPHN